MRPSNSDAGSLFERDDEEIETETSDVDGEDLDRPSEEAGTGGIVFVDVGGEVYQPGVVRAHYHDRVGDVIAAAGGLTSYANTRGLNQAARIYDEMVIFVPHVDDVVEMAEVGSPQQSESSSGSSDLVSISTASQAELQTLPGIGPALSAAIIEYRNNHGSFASIEELTNVPGIGAGILANIRDLIEP